MSTVDLSCYTMVEMAIFNSASLTGSFVPMNDSNSYAIYAGNGYPDDIKILKIYNGSNRDIIVSLDGVTNHDVLPSLCTLIVDLQANHPDNSSYSSGTLGGRKGQILWGLAAAGTGNVYISGFR